MKVEKAWPGLNFWSHEERGERRVGLAETRLNAGTRLFF